MAERARAIVAEVGSIAEAARIGGVSVNTVSRMCAGSHEPGVIAAVLFARGHGLTVEYLLGYGDEKGGVRPRPPGHDDPRFDPRVIDIPVLDARPAAGAGASADVVTAVGSLPFPETFVRKIAPDSHQLSCLRCHGDSMSPTIQDGAIMIVDERQRTPRPFKTHPRKSTRPKPAPDDIFVFYQNGDLRLKRLRDIGDGFVAILSDNHAENPLEIFKPGRDGALKVIGKVVWWDNRL